MTAKEDIIKWTIAKWSLKSDFGYNTTIEALDELWEIAVSNKFKPGSLCCGKELIRFKTYGYDECIECGKTYKHTEF